MRARVVRPTQIGHLTIHSRLPALSFVDPWRTPMRRLALAVAFLTAAMAYAQPGSPARRGNAAHGAAVLSTSSSSGLPIVTFGIKGAPFSAETVTETSRTLADGNRIDATARGNVYRDSEGRTRSR